MGFRESLTRIVPLSKLEEGARLDELIVDVNNCLYTCFVLLVRSIFKIFEIVRELLFYLKSLFEEEDPLDVTDVHIFI